MARTNKQPEELPQPSLTVKRDEALTQLNDRVTKGNELLNLPINSPDELAEAQRKEKSWHEYNEELLSRIFTNKKVADEYIRKSHGVSVWTPQPFYEDVKEFRDDVRRRTANIESLIERLPLIPEDATVQGNQTVKEEHLPDLLHPLVRNECVGLVDAGYYGEAIEKSFKLVRERLRTLTGFETSSEAFGKGHLFIKGAAASNVETDFQEAVKFLGMAIDWFRNEKAHTITPNVSTPERAYQYLVVSSLALYHLDQAEIRKP